MQTEINFSHTERNGSLDSNVQDKDEQRFNRKIDSEGK